MPFAPALLVSLAAVSLRTVSGTLCPPGASLYTNVRVGAGNMHKCRSAIGVHGSSEQLYATSCGIHCRCDPATGKYTWHWERHNTLCPKLGRPVTTADSRALRHPRCGTLAVRTHSGAECPINCYTKSKWYRFVNSGHMEEQKCHGLLL